MESATAGGEFALGSRFGLEFVRQRSAAHLRGFVDATFEEKKMSELSHLVKAVKENLSKEDRVLLRAVYRPPQPDAYDGMFDRVVDRLRDQAHASRNPLRPS